MPKPPSGQGFAAVNVKLTMGLAWAARLFKVVAHQIPCRFSSEAARLWQGVEQIGRFTRGGVGIFPGEPPRNLGPASIEGEAFSEPLPFYVVTQSSCCTAALTRCVFLRISRASTAGNSSRAP